MKRFMVYLFLIFLTVSFSSSNSFAQKGQRQGRGKMGQGYGQGKMGMNGQLYNQLNLNDKQKAEIKKIREAHRGFMKTMRDKKMAIYEKLNAAFKGQATDAEITKIHKEMMDLKMQMGTKRFEKRLAIRKVLTADQRKKFMELKEAQCQSRGMGRGMGMGMGMGNGSWCPMMNFED